MTYSHSRRILATIVAAVCIAVPASASASDAVPATFKSDAAQSGSPASPASTDRTDAAQSGSTPSTGLIAKSTFPTAEFRGGDSPVDHPGASRAPSSAPTTVEVVRPLRTVVRDVDEALPIILSSSALLLVLAGLGFMLVRTRMLQHTGRVH